MIRFPDHTGGMTTPAMQLVRRLKLRDLETLTAVAKTGGLRKASGVLHLSQPAVSRALAELESSLGFRLLVRSRKGVELTQYGHALVRCAATVFDELHEGVREMQRIAEPDSGQIRIACSETINAGLVAAALDRMQRQHPRVSFRVDSGDTPLLLSHFLLGRLSDVAITRPYGAVIDPEIRAEPLYREQLQVVAGRDSRWAKRRKLALAELAGEAWILSPNEATGDSPIVAAFRDAGLRLPAATMLTGSLNVRYTLLATGRFVTVMPRSTLRFVAARAALKVLPIEIGKWEMPTMILTLANRNPSPVVETFLDIVRELCRPLVD